MPQLINEASLELIDSNIRAWRDISPERIAEVAASIAASQQRGGGLFGTGVEQAIAVYENGHGTYPTEDGQTRVLAVRHLIATCPTYNYIGIPAEVRSAPRNLWESTERQVALNNQADFTIFHLVARAVELWKGETPRGSRATWDDVAAVLGHNAPYWSLRQNLLNLIPELREAVLREPRQPGSIRVEMAAIVGRDLPQDLQRQYIDDILANCQRKHALLALIDRILARQTIEQAEPVETEPVDSDDEFVDSDDEPAPVVGPDREAAWLMKTVDGAIARLTALADAGRLQGMAAELHTASTRLADLAQEA